MYDLLPLLWSRSGAPMLRCTMCCRCFGLEVVPHCQDVRFVAVALVSKWDDLLPLLWSRSGAPMPRCTICCHCLVSKWCLNAKMYDLLPLLWSRSGAPMLDLLPLLWPQSCARFLSGTICCCCFGREVVPQFQDVRFVAVALVAKWCPNSKMYDLLPLLWSRSGAPMLRCTICCRCFGLEVVPHCQDVRFVAVALVSKWCPSAKMYDCVALVWPRSGAPMLRCTICCRCFGLEVVPQC